MKKSMWIDDSDQTYFAQFDQYWNESKKQNQDSNQNINTDISEGTHQTTADSQNLCLGQQKVPEFSVDYETNYTLLMQENFDTQIIDEQSIRNIFDTIKLWVLYSDVSPNVNSYKSGGVNNRDILETFFYSSSSQFSYQIKNPKQQNLGSKETVEIVHNQENKIDINNSENPLIVQKAQKPKRKRRSVSSLDAHHVLKNFIESIWSKLQNPEFLQKLKQLYKSKKEWGNNDENQSQKSQLLNSPQTLDKNQNQQQDDKFNNYIEATKQLLSRLTNRQGSKQKSYRFIILNHLTIIQDEQYQHLIGQQMGHLIKQSVITRNKKGFIINRTTKWLYKNEFYYQITRRVLMWYLRRHYRGYVMGSLHMRYKSRNLKYIQRWVYQLRYPGRCKKYYVV